MIGSNYGGVVLFFYATLSKKLWHKTSIALNLVQWYDTGTLIRK